MTIHEQLLAIAARNQHLLQAYEDDLAKHDLDICSRMQPGERWLWILRSYGTVMFPVAAGQDHAWATYWLDETNGHGQETKAFLIKVSGADGASGTLKEVTHRRAVELAKEPAPRDAVYWRVNSPFSMTYVVAGKEVGSVRAYAGTQWHSSLQERAFADQAAAKANVEERFTPQHQAA